MTSSSVRSPTSALDFGHERHVDAPRRCISASRASRDVVSVVASNGRARACRSGVPGRSADDEILTCTNPVGRSGSAVIRDSG